MAMAVVPLVFLYRNGTKRRTLGRTVACYSIRQIRLNTIAAALSHFKPEGIKRLQWQLRHLLPPAAPRHDFLTPGRRIRS
jgi:hypothetical protein